jgi:hypothetical protein
MRFYYFDPNNLHSYELLPLRRKADTASLHGRKTAVAGGSLNQIARRKARDGEDIQEPWMNKRKTGT